MIYRFIHFVYDFDVSCTTAEQVSEEVERALAKLGPAKLTGRYYYHCFSSRSLAH